jgi:CheY-like chemotaxis protein
MTTTDLPRILNVDDDDIMRDMVADMLGGAFRVLTANGGEECLSLLHESPVDLILLDVEMSPGIDGYETCRRLKKDDALAEIPVIFLSGHDRIEDRLKGYEAGGDDYVVKPCDPVELESKIRTLLRLHAERNQQKEMASYASKAAMTAMTSLGEMGVLIETMKRFSACDTVDALADACLEGLAAYGLHGAIQVRANPETTLTRDSNGTGSPLLASVINHMAGMDRITSFKSRMSVAYEHLSLLVNDMPVDDPDRCGRLRDHLAMLVEAAQVRIRSIIFADALNTAVEKLTATLSEIDAAQRQSRMEINLGLNTLDEALAKAYVHLGLTTSQEDLLSGIVRESIDKILHSESAGIDIQDKLSTLVRELKDMVGGHPKS